MGQETIFEINGIQISNTNTASRAPVFYQQTALPLRDRVCDSSFAYSHWAQIGETVVKLITDSPYLGQMLPQAFNFPVSAGFETSEYQLSIHVGSDKPTGMYIDPWGNVEITGTSWYGNVKNALAGIVQYDSFARNTGDIVVHSLINGPFVVIGATGTGKSSVGAHLGAITHIGPFSEDLTLIQQGRPLQGINLETDLFYPRLATLESARGEISNIKGLLGLENASIHGSILTQEQDFSARAFIDPDKVYGYSRGFEQPRCLVVLSWGIPASQESYWQGDGILAKVDARQVSGYLRDYQAPVLSNGKAKDSFLPSPFEQPVILSKDERFMDYLAQCYNGLAQLCGGALLINTKALLYDDKGLRRPQSESMDLTNRVGATLARYHQDYINSINGW
jgi:hypothetical protein